MSIFLDTSDIKDIKKYNSMGVIRGVTTNPSIILKNGIGEFNSLKEWGVYVADLIKPFPLSIEVTTNDMQKILAQADEYSSWADNINVKVTIHDEDGKENLSIIKILETVKNIRVNVTAMMSAQQCFLASLAGASYVSLFGGRVNNMGYNVNDEIVKLRSLINAAGTESKIIIGSVRESINITEWIESGADIVTVPPSFIDSMLVHPYSKETVKQFMDDSRRNSVI